MRNRTRTRRPSETPLFRPSLISQPLARMRFSAVEDTYEIWRRVDSQTQLVESSPNEHELINPDAAIHISINSTNPNLGSTPADRLRQTSHIES